MYVCYVVALRRKWTQQKILFRYFGGVPRKSPSNKETWLLRDTKGKKLHFASAVGQRYWWIGEVFGETYNKSQKLYRQD